MNGIFITLEGNEGVGKSTQAKMLVEALNKYGHQAILIREPGGTSIGEEVRTVLKTVRAEPVFSETELFLFQASRAQLVRQVIKPAISEGKIVIADRFTDSTWVYQGWARGINLLSVEFTNRLATGGLQPDITFLLTAPLDVAKARTVTRGTTDRFEMESRAFFEKVESGFLELAQNNQDRIALIDTTRSIEEVHRDLVERTHKLIEGKI
jgi:dTMP kinase